MGISARPASAHFAGNRDPRTRHAVRPVLTRHPLPAPGRGCQPFAGRTYRRSMLRIVLLVLAVIFVVFVAAAVARTLVWLALIALIVAAAGLLLAGVRRAHGSARRDRHRS
jgi:uncharacterized membrane protein YedE/YeeE